jgi:hypothetical protein
MARTIPWLRDAAREKEGSACAELLRAAEASRRGRRARPDEEGKERGDAAEGEVVVRETGDDSLLEGPVGREMGRKRWGAARAGGRGGDAR